MDCEKFSLDFYRNGTAVALGCFDGLHIGHKAVIDTAVNFAKTNSLKSVVFQIKRTSDTLLTCAETADILRLWDVDKIVPQLLNAEFKNLSCEEFVENYLRNFLCAKFVSIGYNFRFGKDASGDAETLQKLCNRCGIKAYITSAVCVDGDIVSSTKIRELLNCGENVSRYLGR